MTLHARLDEARTVSTPAATMRTLASPTTAADLPLAVWRTDLPAATSGPAHVIDVDQFVVVLAGAIDVRIGDDSYLVGTGDGLKLPAGLARTIAAANGEPAATLTVGTPDAHATVGDNEPVPVPWTA